VPKGVGVRVSPWAFGNKKHGSLRLRKGFPDGVGKVDTLSVTVE
jgi:hypothetical protein